VGKLTSAFVISIVPLHDLFQKRIYCKNANFKLFVISLKKSNFNQKMFFYAFEVEKYIEVI